MVFLNRNGTPDRLFNPDVKIASGLNGGPTLAEGDYFGSSVASLGDLDGDGVTDLAVGARGDDTGDFGVSGAVHVLLLKSDGTVKSSVKIASGTNGGPTLAIGDRFGSSVASLGDLDGDGVTDLAVGADWDDTGGAYRGALHVLLLNADGTAKSSVKIASGTGGGPTLANYDYFGSSVAALGDLDGDGVTDLAVGAYGDDTGGSYRGAVHVLFLKAPNPFPWYNTAKPLDVSKDGSRTSIDALIIFNRLNSVGPGAVPSDAQFGIPFFYDPSHDNFVTSLDALLVFNYLNAGGVPEGEGAHPDAEAASADCDLISLLAWDVSQRPKRQRSAKTPSPDNSILLVVDGNT